MTFSADWLALREPLDHASRDTDLLGKTISIVGSDAVIVDLGSGTGSTARAFNDPLCQSWNWRLVDSDQTLLKIAEKQHPTSDQFVMDLNAISELPLDRVSLVTASALLDIMSRQWVSQLARRLCQASSAFYAAINYNGAMHWTPAHDEDKNITDAFNLHQLTDKGSGPALGPTAATETAAIFTKNGFQVTLADSPWRIGPEDAELHLELIQGIGSAAAESGHTEASSWIEARRASVKTTTGYIGHTDLLAVPHKL